MASINFSEYDVLGFDMDFTLARYELVPFFNMAYETLTKYLVDVKNYDPCIFHNLHEDKDLVYKGLIVDFEKGNILKLCIDGKILRATHGTKKMSDTQIKMAYGADRTFADYDRFIDGLKSVNSRWRFFENYFDIPGLVAFAKIVDHLTTEEQGREERKVTYDHVWVDVLSALEDMYIPSQYADNQGGFFPEMKKNLAKYVDKASDQMISWLKALRQNGRMVFFLTSSYVDFGTMVMNHVYGDNWKSLFDLNLFAGRKPRFFTENRPFVEVNGITLGEETKTLKENGSYCYGNHADLMKFFKTKLGKFDPKVLYFGDNLWADAWPSKTLGKWGSVLILEEMDAEGYAVTDGTVPGHEADVEDPDAPPRKKKRKYEHSSLVTEDEIELMVSNFWGSTFIDPSLTGSTSTSDGKSNTAFGHLIARFSDICVPSVEYLAGVPVDHEFTSFSEEPGNPRGYHPGKPKSLLL